MKLSLYLAYKNLISHKKLFFLLTGIIIFSFINLTFFDAINNGVRTVTNDKLQTYVFADLRIMTNDEDIFITDTNVILQKLRKIPEIYDVAPRLITQESITDGKNFFPVTVIGMDVNDDMKIMGYQDAVKIGNFLNNNNNEVVLGDEIIGNLDGGKSNMDFTKLNLGVGETFEMNYANGVLKEYKVRGIFDTLFWISDFNLLMSIDEVRSVYGYSNDISSEILIKLYDGVDKTKVKEKIINTGIKYKVVDSLEESGIADNILEGQKVTTVLANIIGVFSTFITTFIVIYINAISNKKQLGILKAIGIDEKKIINSYLIQSFFYAIAGIIFGAITLYGIVYYLQLNPIKLPMGYFYPMPSLKAMIFAGITIIISALVAGYVASSKIIKSNIVSVLRGE